MTEVATQEITAARKRSASHITLVTFALTSLIALATLFLVPAADKTPIDDFAMPFIAAASGVSYLLTLRGRHVPAIYILLLSIGIVCAAYPFAADNIGWQTAIGMLLITTTIANSALPEKSAGRISTAAFGFAIAIVLIELFFTGAVSNPVTTPSVIAIVALAAVYLGLILYRFRHFGLRTKFVTIFILLSVITVGATAVSVSALVLRQLNEKIEQQVTGISTLTATSISNVLTTQIQLTQALALDEFIQLSLEGRDATNDTTTLMRLDEEWRAADAANDNGAPVVKSVLENEASVHLREFALLYPTHVEISLTDIYGATVAATSRTDDYYQADEEWWQYAYSGGNGGTYVSQPAFDEDSGVVSLQIAVPVINDDGSVVGIVNSTLDLRILVPSLELGRLGKTGEIEIYMPGKLELALFEKDGAPALHIEPMEEDLSLVLEGQTGIAFLNAAHEGVPVMIGITPVNATDAEDPATRDAVQRLNWTIVALQDREEALQAVSETSRIAQLVGLASIILASLFAVGFTQFLTRPIFQLTQAAEEISKGNLEASAPVESADEVGALAVSFNRMTGQLADTLANLEKRIAERTTDLELARRQTEFRASQLLAIGEISKIINTQQELNILLPLITRLVSDSFGFYHTGIFLVDEARQFAVLLAANSLGGQAMLRRGHKLKVGESGIVGYVARAGTPRTALDVGADPVFFNNPDLPTTRSELALPLIFRDQIIGVLDAQSERPGAFTDEDVNILKILADQIAISIENTRLLEQTQQALREVQSLYQTNLQKGWQNYAPGDEMVGYQQSLTGGNKLTRPLSADELNQAMYRGETLIFHADGKTSEPTLVVPIKLREQIIGVMRIKAPTHDRQWSASEISLTETVAERLSLALENARLLQDSQRQAVKEQAISEITGKIGSSINLENVLLTAVEELGRTIPGSEVTIKLKQDNQHDGSK